MRSIPFGRVVFWVRSGLIEREGTNLAQLLKFLERDSNSKLDSSDTDSCSDSDGSGSESDSQAGTDDP